MSKRNPGGIGGLDWISFSLYLSLVVIGWLMIYTVGYGDGYEQQGIDFILKTSAGKQGLMIGISLVLIFLITVIEWKFWRTVAFIIFIATMLSLVLVLLIGSTIKGATSWFHLPGGFSLQPAEFAKFGTALALSAFLSSYSSDLSHLKTRFNAIAIFALPIFLVLLQPDAGSALIFLSFFIVLFREGMPIAPYAIGAVLFLLFLGTLTLGTDYTILGVLAILIFFLISNLKKAGLYHYLAFFVWLAVMVLSLQYGFQLYGFGVSVLLLIGLCLYHWLNRQPKLGTISLGGGLLAIGLVLSVNYAFNNILKSHQQDRLNVWLNPAKCDPQGSLYNVLQSKLAIGSGGFQGKGFLQGTLTKLNFVPEQSTDFIFCTIGEEQGFIGSVAVILLYTYFIYRLTVLAERQRNDFSRMYIYSIAGILFVHFFINIGMTMGLVPIIGIPLPFISYGGSSLLAFSIMVAVALKLDSHRYSI